MNAENRINLLGEFYNNLKLSKFKNLALTKTYSDKTPFIEAVLTNQFRNILITTPKGYGKTANLTMLKTFFEIQIDKKTLEVIDRKNSKNYDIFKKNNFLIFQNDKFFEKNFGIYPVIYIRFSEECESDFYSDEEKIIDDIRKILYNTFRKHLYLINSENLDSEEKSHLKKFCTDPLYKFLYRNEIVKGLRFLVKCLYKHFNEKRVIVLIDGYDTIINIGFSIKNNICRMYDFVEELMLYTLYSEYIEKAVITGVHYINLFGTLEIEKYLTLRNHEFEEYFGITGSEFGKMLNKFEGNTQAQLPFLNIFDKHIAINCLNSKTINFKRSVQCLDAIDYREQREINDIFSDLHRALKVPVIRFFIDKLYFNEFVVTKVFDKLRIQDLIDLYNIYHGNSESLQLRKPDQLFSFLLYKGSFKYVKKINNNLCKIKCISNYVREDLYEFYELKYKKNTNDISETRYFKNLDYFENCAKYLLKMCPTSTESDFKEIVFHFNKLTRRIKCPNDDILHDLIFDVMCKTDFSIGEELKFTNEKQNLIFYKENLRLIIQGSVDSNKNTLKIIFDKYASILEEKSADEDLTDEIYLGITLKTDHTINMKVLVNSRNLDEAVLY